MIEGLKMTSGTVLVVIYGKKNYTMEEKKEGEELGTPYRNGRE